MMWNALGLALLPAQRGDRLDEMMRPHLQEAATVSAILADEDRPAPCSAGRFSAPTMSLSDITRICALWGGARLPAPNTPAPRRRAIGVAALPTPPMNSAASSDLNPAACMRRYAAIYS
jgi:hypothetical protein